MVVDSYELLDTADDVDGGVWEHEGEVNNTTHSRSEMACVEGCMGESHTQSRPCSSTLTLVPPTIPIIDSV